MASTYSPSLRIELIGAGDQAGTWNTTTNTNLGTLIETSIAGNVAVSVTSANQALTANNGVTDQARQAILTLTTTTTAAFAVYAPPQTKQYIVYNTTAYAATIYNSTVLGNTTAAGLGVAVAAGRKVVIFSDATNFRSAEPADLTGAVTSVGNVTSLGSFTSAQLLAALTDETGTGANVFATSPTLVTPALGTPTALVGTNITGTAAGLTAGNVTTNANLTGDVTSVGNATTLSNTAVSAGSYGSASLIPVVTVDSKGRVTGVTTVAPATQYTGVNFQVFQTSGTWTRPAGVTSVKVTIFGGGAGGYGNTNTGGNGACGVAWVTGLSGNVTVTVGAGGNGGQANPSTSGTAGGTSSFGTYVTATGGAPNGTVGAFSTTGTNLQHDIQPYLLGGGQSGDSLSPCSGGGGLSTGGTGGTYGVNTPGSIALGPGSSGGASSGGSFGGSYGGPGGGPLGGTGGGFGSYANGPQSGGGGGTGGVIVQW